MYTNFIVQKCSYSTAYPFYSTWSPNITKCQGTSKLIYYNYWGFVIIIDNDSCNNKAKKYCMFTGQRPGRNVLPSEWQSSATESGSDLTLNHWTIW